MLVLYEKYDKREWEKSGAEQSKQTSPFDRFCISEGKALDKLPYIVQTNTKTCIWETKQCVRQLKLLDIIKVHGPTTEDRKFHSNLCFRIFTPFSTRQLAFDIVCVNGSL